MNEIIIKKAQQSICRYKIVAVGFDKKGDLLGKVTNKPRLRKYHGGLHAEMALLVRYGSRIKTIVLCRVNKHGKLLPIQPCESCNKVLKSLNIKVKTII